MHESGPKNECDVIFFDADSSLSHRLSALYGIGSVGTATFVIVPQLYLLFFMTEWLAIPATMAAAVLLVPKLWEFFFDPAIGAWSDRTYSRWGRRVPFMLAGTVLFAISFAYLFGPPVVGSAAVQAVVMGILYLVCTSAYALYSVPYITVPAELGENGRDRDRVIAWRMAFVSLGVLLAGVSAPLLVDLLGGGRDGFATMGLVLSVAASLCMLASVAAVRRLPQRTSIGAPLPLRSQLSLALRNKAFSRLWVTYCIQLIATAVSLAALPYFVKYVLLADEEVVTIAFIIFTVTSLAFLPVTAMFARRIGHQRAYVAASFVYAAGQLSVLFAAAPDRQLALFLAFALIGIGNAGQQLLPFAMLPQTIDHDRARTGTNREGAYTGFWVAGEKLGLAVGGALAAGVFALGGLVEHSGGGLGQPQSAVSAIVLSMTAIPAILFLVSLWPLSGFQTALRPKGSPA